MTESRKKIALILTHVLALTLGILTAWIFQENTDETHFSLARDSSSRQNRADRSMANQKNLDNALWQAASTRSPAWLDLIASRGGWKMQSSEKRPRPTEIVANMVDARKSLENAVAHFNETGQAENHLVVHEIIRRLMREDPEGTMAYLGQVRLKSGWGDPFIAIFESETDPIRLLSMMGKNWLPSNYASAIRGLGYSIKGERVRQLPRILAHLPDNESRKTITSQSLHRVQNEDLAAWLDIGEQLQSSDYRTIQELLANAFYPTPPPNRRFSKDSIKSMRENNKTILAQVKGSTFEDAFSLKIASQENELRKTEALNEISNNPLEALNKLIALEMESGKTEGKARELAIKKAGKELENWQRKDILKAMQAVVSGRERIAQTLPDFEEKIRRELPQEFQSAKRQEFLSMALEVDPQSTVAYLLKDNRQEDLQEVAGKLLSGQQLSLFSLSNITAALVETPIWSDQVSIRNQLQEFTREFKRDYPDQASHWLQSLPAQSREKLQKSVAP